MKRKVDRRVKNRAWAVLNEDGKQYGTYTQATFAVLMDLRDELQKLNRTTARIANDIARRQPPRELTAEIRRQIKAWQAEEIRALKAGDDAAARACRDKVGVLENLLHQVAA